MAVTLHEDQKKLKRANDRWKRATRRRDGETERERRKIGKGSDLRGCTRRQEGVEKSETLRQELDKTARKDARKRRRF